MRDKVFGAGRVTPLDRNGKARLAHFARGLMRRAEAGRHWGTISAKDYEVLKALLYGFHNCISGKCFPSYRAIAEKAGCASSTVGKAIRALEHAALITWQQRRVRVSVPQACVEGGFKLVKRILRTSNAYTFRDPLRPETQVPLTKTETRRETTNQIFTTCGKSLRSDEDGGVEASLRRFREAFDRDLERKRFAMKEVEA